MRVAIYGDSFADPKVRGSTIVEDNILAWPDIVSQYHSVANFARGGTSTYYSYQKFLGTHESFDKIIFVITDYYRWYHLVHNPGKKSPHNDNYHAVTSPVMCNFLRKDSSFIDNAPNSVKQSLDAIDSYFFNLKDDKFDETICGLMLDDIKNKRPDTIFVTGGTFHNYHPLVNRKTSIAQFALTWLKNWPNYEDKIVGFLPWEERRVVCHLAKEVNELVAAEMLRAIDNGRWDPTIPDFIQAEHIDFDYYYNVDGFNWAKRGKK